MQKITAPQRLMDAAEQELIASGGHMEMSAVAKRAKASVGLAYHHFGSKTGLMAAVVDRFYGPLRAIALGDEIPVEWEWREREKARTAALIAYFYDRPLAPLVAGRLARQPEVLDIEQNHRDALLEMGARNIAQGQRLGVVAPELAPSETVAMLMGGLRLAIDRAITSETRPPREQLLEQVWLFCRGALRLDEHHPQNDEGEHCVR
ncbi:MAG: TetR/AcrR family transcriptional regulator [Parvularculaceae bacterium]|nr:TetR/AcrR family transcriptional regulator [Parvularculaceae bacterium]